MKKLSFILGITGSGVIVLLGVWYIAATSYPSAWGLFSYLAAAAVGIAGSLLVYRIRILAGILTIISSILLRIVY